MNNTSALNLSHFPPVKALQSLRSLLERIFEATDLETLKCLREISSLWHSIATQELRKQVTIRMCFCSHIVNRNVALNRLQQGKLILPGYHEIGNGPLEKLAILRRTDNPYDPRPTPFTIPNLIRMITRNPSSFPCVSFEITTQFLGSEHIRHFFQHVGSTIRRLKLVLHYFRYCPTDLSFEDTLIEKDLRTLLLFRTPSLEHLHLISRLPQRLFSEVLNLQLNPTRNFLKDEHSSRSRLTLKSFTYEGLLPRQILHDIIQASVHLRRVREIESAEEFVKRMEVPLLQTLNPYWTQQLEWASGKYTGKICTLHCVWFRRYLSENDAYYVELYNDILESHAQTLTHLQFATGDFRQELRIPAMPKLKELRFFSYPQAEIKLFVSTEVRPDECKGGGCKVASKFPKLELLVFSSEFNFGAHFALTLGVDPSGPFSSIKTVHTAADCSWDVVDAFCTEMSPVFPCAEMCIGEDRELLPAFSLSQKPQNDPRQAAENPQ